MLTPRTTQRLVYIALAMLLVELVLGFGVRRWSIHDYTVEKVRINVNAIIALACLGLNLVVLIFGTGIGSRFAAAILAFGAYFFLLVTSIVQ